MPPSDSVLLGVFYAFSLAGQLVLTACLLTIFIARIQRDLTLINAAVAGLLFATACLLLLFSNEFRGPPPRFRNCLAQACLIYGSLAMAASSVFCLFFQLWYSLFGTIHNQPRSQSKPLGVVLRVIPWLSFAGMSLTSLIDGLRDRDDVTRSRDFFYCAASHRVGYASEMLCGAYMLISLLLELHIAYMLVYGWKARTLRKDILPIDRIRVLDHFADCGHSFGPSPKDTNRAAVPFSVHVNE
ncbi:hypothetical protein AURDEDRAFT_166475 [Auricularia subglabra TFB-10046 SS5]|nr:hypothetical protein AURDEDRAFT_166475 [Auricularia subglabra TFB-10046 SS5]